MKLNLDFTGTTLLKDWWKTVKENFDAIQSRFNSHCTQKVIDHPSGSVTTEKIADYAIKTMKLAENSVSAGKIVTDAVRTTHIKDGNVTMAKLHGDIQTKLNNFQTHINNPSQEIRNNTVTKDKFAIDERSDYERSVSTVSFINSLYGCRAFLWTKEQMVLPDSNFPTEYDLYDEKQVVDEDFKENVWYLYNHDGTFSVASFTYIFNNTKIYYGLRNPFGAEGMYALKFYTTTPAQGTGIASGTCEVIKLTEGDFESMINGRGSVSADSELSVTSTNPVQNKVIKAELDKKYEIPNEDADILLQYIGTDESGNGTQVNVDLFVPYIYAGNDGGNVILENVACLEFKDSNGFKDIDEITQAILDLQDRISALEG